MILFSNAMSAQQTNNLAGEYYLQGVRETASGFKLNTDSTFQFFFSYGALDRPGQGTWSVQNKQVIFNSKNHPGNDFALVSSKKTNNGSLVIKIVETNTFFLSHVYCEVQQGGMKSGKMSNNEGLILFQNPEADTLSLTFEFCPERKSVFTISGPRHNYFEFRFEPWMMEVFFKDFNLDIDDQGLEGAHPLLNGRSYHYIKNK
jgi:hypothetical protein